MTPDSNFAQPIGGNGVKDTWGFSAVFLNNYMWIYTDLKKKNVKKNVLGMLYCFKLEGHSRPAYNMLKIGFLFKTPGSKQEIL